MTVRARLSIDERTSPPGPFADRKIVAALGGALSGFGALASNPLTAAMAPFGAIVGCMGGEPGSITRFLRERGAS